jgi:hypothetical protein
MSRTGGTGRIVERNARCGVALAVATCAALSLVGCTGGTSSAEADHFVQQRVARDDSRPETVLKELMLAVLQRDEATIRRLTLDNPGREILWERDPTVPPQPPVTAQTVALLEHAPWRAMKRGETFTLETRDGPKSVTLGYHDVNDGRAVVMDPFGQVPHIVVKTDSKWLVDPGALVAARTKARDLRLRNADGTPRTNRAL